MNDTTKTVIMSLLIKSSQNSFNSLNALKPLLTVGHFSLIFSALNTQMFHFINDTNVFLNYIYTETFPVKFFTYSTFVIDA